MHKSVRILIFACMLLRLSRLLTSTCFVLQHGHLWELFLKTSCDRLVYGLFLLIQNWHASMKMAMASLLFCGCDHTGEAVSGHVPKVLYSLQPPRQFDSLEGHPKVVNIAI